MNKTHQDVFTKWAGRDARGRAAATPDTVLLRIVDAGLIAILCAAPFVLGWSSDLGRLIYASLVAATAAAWLIRQCILPEPRWVRTGANVIIVLAAVFVILQLVPLPAAVIQWLAPRTAELLPLWTPNASPVSMGTWHTLSLVPHDTTIALCMLLSHGLLFMVVSQRVQNAHDVGRVLKVIAVSAVLMACFGLLQYATSNGHFLWFFEHPFRTADECVQGSFANRNHFASFLVLGIGPLFAWLMIRLTQAAADSTYKHGAASSLRLPLAALIVAIAVVILAVLLSLSRGGSLALATSLITISAVYYRWGHLDIRYAVGAVVLVVGVVGALSIYGYDLVATRLDDFVEGSLNSLDHNEGRRKIWKANVAAFQHGWLTGAGAGAHCDIHPAYLTTAVPFEYTHAENGYLQIATEGGIIGLALLASAFGLVGYWLNSCLRRTNSAAEQFYVAAVAAGLAASAVHSLTDFVWYIPACMSMTVVLAACALRLAQTIIPGEDAKKNEAPLLRPRAFALAAAGIITGAWCIVSLVGPAMASVHWNRYLRTSLDKSEVTRQQLSAVLEGKVTSDTSVDMRLLDAMIRHLEVAAQWDPACPRIQSRLAAKYLARFELLQQQSVNAMPLFQIREAAFASQFGGAAELQSWLQRAVGGNIEWLHRAHDHARRAVDLGPLQSDAYLHLANLCFLDGSTRQAADALANQALAVRPHDPDILFQVGKLQLFSHNIEAAIDTWARCFHAPGKHQLLIIQILAGPQIPAAAFLERLQPDWTTLLPIWTRYRRFGTREDLDSLVEYAARAAERQVGVDDRIRPEYVWLSMASMYRDLERLPAELASLERAHAVNPHLYGVRSALSIALMKAERYAEAEPHIRWCLARRPDNTSFKAYLLEISKRRFANQTQTAVRVQ